MENNRKWMVIYPQGRRSWLDIAHVLDYEKEQYALASLKEFDEEKEAASYARKLSQENSIALEPHPTSRFLHILDLDE